VLALSHYLSWFVLAACNSTVFVLRYCTCYGTCPRSKLYNTSIFEFIECKARREVLPSSFNNLSENTVVGKCLVLLFPGPVRHILEGEVVAVKEVTFMHFYPVHEL
jgi:hypothetical protein